jgi:hypothetical protein
MANTLNKGVGALMAKKLSVVLIDDIDKKSIGDETLQFELDGVIYEIDLASGNAQELRGAFAMWIGRARKTGDRNRSNGRDAMVTRNAAIRYWARKQGYEVAERGRIPTTVHHAYHVATKKWGSARRDDTPAAR